MTLSDLDPLKIVRQGLKSWVTRSINLANKYDAEGKLTLTILAKLEDEINGYINKIKENEEQISLVYDQNHVDLEDSSHVADMDATVNFIFESQVTLAGYEDKLHGQVTGQGSLPNVDQAKNLTREELLEVVTKIILRTQLQLSWIVSLSTVTF